jgi:hypothetical protein
MNDYPKTMLRLTDGEKLIAPDGHTVTWAKQNGFIEIVTAPEVVGHDTKLIEIDPEIIDGLKSDLDRPMIEVEKISNEELERRRPGRPRKCAV